MFTYEITFCINKTTTKKNEVRNLINLKSTCHTYFSLKIHLIDSNALIFFSLDEL